MRKTTQNPAEDYKYRILEHLKKLPHEEYKMVRMHLHRACGIGKSTMDRYLYMKKKDKGSMPAEVLVVLATFLHVSEQEIFNYEIPGQHYIKQLRAQ